MFAKKLALLLDDKFELFGIKFGLDPLLDLVPWVGDIVAVTLGAYIIVVGIKMRLPSYKIWKMVFNCIIDYVIGLIPAAGPLITIFFRSNRMNIEIIEDHLRGDRVEEGVIV